MWNTMTHTGHCLPFTPPAYLRLFDPLPPAGRSRPTMRLSPNMTLSEFFAAHVLPAFLRPTNASKRNIDQYRESLKLWEAITAGPSIHQIGQATCAEFVAKLQQRKWRGARISVNTVRKHCVAVQKIIDLAGPRTRKNRVAVGLFCEEPPYLERPAKQTHPVRDDFSLDEIRAIIAACQAAVATDNLAGVPPTIWWTSLFLFLQNTGLRIGTAMCASWSMFDPHYPGWLDIPPAAYKGGRNGGYFYVNSHARKAIEQVRQLAGADCPSLFPWKNWPVSANWLQRCRRKIMDSSGLPGHRRFGFHGCRKFLGTWVAPQNALLASIILGHKSANVTRDSYVNPKVVEELLERVPQPTI
jgi:integrase